jgi:hypothetical protein
LTSPENLCDVIPFLQALTQPFQAAYIPITENQCGNMGNPALRLLLTGWRVAFSTIDRYV